MTNDRGASSVEYALIVAAIAALIVTVVYAIGRLTDNNYDQACDKFAAEVSEPAC